jgi:hypothetical protein
LRILISQNVELKYLVPKAILKLKENIFEEALYYPGDLMLSLLNVHHDYWQQKFVDREKFAILLNKAKPDLEIGFKDSKTRNEVIELVNKFLLVANN